jgi:hypothetical protein
VDVSVICGCLLLRLGLIAQLPSTAAAASAAPAEAVHADVVLTAGQDQQPTTVRVGQVIKVVEASEADWSVSYRPEVLRALTPLERMRKPGPEGWLFRAIIPGATEITLESSAPPCPPGQPCAPNVMRRVFPIQVVP